MRCFEPVSQVIELKQRGTLNGEPNDGGDGLAMGSTYLGRWEEQENGVLAGAANRSIEELELKRDTMLIEVLARRAKGEKRAQTATAGAGTAPGTK